MKKIIMKKATLNMPCGLLEKALQKILLLFEN